MRSFQGGLERAWSRGCIRSSYIILKPLEQIESDFYGYLLKLPGYIKALQRTASFIRDGQDLNFDNFSRAFKILCQANFKFLARCLNALQNKWLTEINKGSNCE